MSFLFILSFSCHLLRNSVVISIFVINNECREEWGERFEATSKVIRECWGRGLVTHDSNFECYTLNSQGPCEEGARIVYKENSTCPQTWCLPYTDQSSTFCSSSNVEFLGSCVDPEDPSLCEHHPGRRLVPDLWGIYSCQCSPSLGFLEIEGECHPKYLQGPCQKGDQVVRGSHGEGVCRHDSCFNFTTINSTMNYKDYYEGLGGICYNLLQLFYLRLESLKSSLSSDEILLFKNDSRFKTSSYEEATGLSFGACLETHCTCRMVSRNTGDCLETVKLDPNRFNEILDWDHLFEYLETVDEVKQATKKKRRSQCQSYIDDEADIYIWC